MNVVARITKFNAGRDPERLQLKYQRMAEDAFAFLRGTCHLFYEDWSVDTPLNEAPLAWICGDLHLENFGAFKGDNRLVYFDINDFDEAVLAPCTWELARLLISVLVAAKTLDLPRSAAVQLCQRFLDAYCQALQTGKARWVEHETAEGMIKELLDSLQQRNRPEFLDKRTELEQGKRRFCYEGKHLFPLTVEQSKQLRCFMEQFASRQSNPAFFECLDVAGRIAGLGSLGVERYAILVEGKGSPDHNYLLDLKQAPGSSLQPYLQWSQPAWPTPAERVVAVQRRVQAVSPAFLHAVTLAGKAFVLKALQPQEDRLALERWQGHLQRLDTVLVTMSQSVAWGQLRSAGRQGSAIADEWIAFGARQDWQAPLLDYAQAYSKQVQEDWKTFRDACKQGRLGSSGNQQPAWLMISAG